MSGVHVSESLDVNASLQKVLVLVQWVEEHVEVLVWWTVILLQAGVGVSDTQVGLQLVLEVSLGEESEVWHPVVSGGGLVVPGVLEGSGVRVRQVEWHVRVSIVDTVQFFALHESEEVVLDNWALSIGGMLGSSGLSLDGITEGKDVLES